MCHPSQNEVRSILIKRFVWHALLNLWNDNAEGHAHYTMVERLMLKWRLIYISAAQTRRFTTRLHFGKTCRRTTNAMLNLQDFDFLEFQQERDRPNRSSCNTKGGHETISKSPERAL